MREPLIKTETSIREILLEFRADLSLANNVDFDALKGLLEAMKPIKLAIENLSREDPTLLSADTILEFMFEKFSLVNSEISKKLMDNLKIRVNECLNTDVMNLLRLLKNSTITPFRDTITFAGILASQLFGVHDVNIIEATSSYPTDEILTLQEELNELLKKNESQIVSSGQDNFRWLTAEFTFFKNTGQPTENLQKLYDALLTIKPTSTDVERVFSVCANFCTKIRS